MCAWALNVMDVCRNRECSSTILESHLHSWNPTHHFSWSLFRQTLMQRGEPISTISMWHASIFPVSDKLEHKVFRFPQDKEPIINTLNVTPTNIKPLTQHVTSISYTFLLSCKHGSQLIRITALDAFSKCDDLEPSRSLIDAGTQNGHSLFSIHTFTHEFLLIIFHGKIPHKPQGKEGSSSRQSKNGLCVYFRWVQPISTISKWCVALVSVCD